MRFGQQWSWVVPAFIQKKSRACSLTQITSSDADASLTADAVYESHHYLDQHYCRQSLPQATITTKFNVHSSVSPNLPHGVRETHEVAAAVKLVVPRRD